MKELLNKFMAMGWYGGTLDLITIKLQGGFETFTGRASETWEHQFIVSNCAMPHFNILAHEAKGPTLEIACAKLLEILKKENPV